jgi:hypothetical protein
MEDFFSFKKGLKRFVAAMKGIPDRVPVCTQIHEFVMEELGANAKEFYTTPELLRMQRNFIPPRNFYQPAP